jgi:2-methylcitrate dehydratase PrpD
MTGPASIFEGRLGFLNAYGDLKGSDLSRLDRGLGSEWEVERISIKPYPCCHFGHAFIDCAALMRKAGVRVGEIESIECVVPEIEVQMVCEPVAQKRVPTTPYGAKFSLPFMVALGLVDGEIGPASFTPESIQRRDLLDLAKKVSYRVAAPGETTFPKYFPGWINVTLKDGTTRSEKMDINWGTPERPMDDASLKAKFLQNLVSARPGTAQALADAVLSMGNRSARDVAAAIRALV